MKLTIVLMLFVLGLLGSRTILRADSLPPTPGFFTTIDVPGATSTSITAISSSGDLAGTFTDSTGAVHGFVDSHGIFTKFDFPAGSEFSEVTGVNDAGQVVGSYFSGGPFGQGFLYGNGTFSLITPYSAGLYPHGINNAGEVVGLAQSCLIDVVCQSGFMYSDGTVTTYRFPVPEPYSADTSFAGINNHGEIIGTYRAGIEHHGYSYSGAFVDFMPFSVPGATSTGPTGINDAGVTGPSATDQIVGTYSGGSGFLYSNGSFSTLDFSPTGISNSAQIVGGGDFVFTVTPEPASLVLFGSGLAAIAIVIRRRSEPKRTSGSRQR